MLQLRRESAAASADAFSLAKLAAVADHGGRVVSDTGQAAVGRDRCRRSKSNGK